MDGNENLFDKISDELIDAGEVQPGTMMGFPCLRVRNTYIACKDKSIGTLVVKLTENRVETLVRLGHAKVFAPAGRVFKCWASMETFDEGLWRSVIREARKLAEES